jgi:hypothetical protein
VDRSEFFTILLESKNMTVCSREIPFSGEFQLPPEQLSAEHPPPPSNRIPQEGSHFVALPAGATSPLLLRSRTTTTMEQIALRVILLLHLLIQGKKCTRHFEKIRVQNEF